MFGRCTCGVRAVRCRTTAFHRAALDGIAKDVLGRFARFACCASADWGARGVQDFV
jgi:hypothetical protein